MAWSDTSDSEKRLHEILDRPPANRIILKPIAPPAALGLACFAGSTFIAATWIADWLGNDAAPTTFFPFVGIFGGLAQFIAGIYGFAARDTLIAVVNTMWGSFWIAIGILVYIEEAYGPKHFITRFFPVGRRALEKQQPFVVSGVGEPSVGRGMPKM